ncbi:chlorohydrolase [Streptococcus pneumoniae]|nr:chlorohydrolase [Streptococcus pneumoniae]
MKLTKSAQNSVWQVSSKHCFEVVDKTDKVSSKYCFEVVDETDASQRKTVFWIRLTKSVTYIYGKATLTRFEFDFRRVLTSHKGSWELRNVISQ